MYTPWSPPVGAPPLRGRPPPVGAEHLPGREWNTQAAQSSRLAAASLSLRPRNPARHGECSPKPPMASRDHRTLDLALGLVLLTAGLGSIAYASRGGPAVFHFVPALDGCLTVGVVAFILALLDGQPFRSAVFILLPIVAIQSIGAQQHHSSWFAVVGIEATVVGLLGTLLALRASHAEPPATEKRSPGRRGSPAVGAMPPLTEGA